MCVLTQHFQVHMKWVSMNYLTRGSRKTIHGPLHLPLDVFFFNRDSVVAALADVRTSLSCPCVRHLIFSFPLHFLCNGPSKREKTVVASENFDGKLQKIASS